MTDFSCLAYVSVLDDKVYGKKVRGSHRLTKIYNIIEVTDFETYESIKRTAVE